MVYLFCVIKLTDHGDGDLKHKYPKNFPEKHRTVDRSNVSQSDPKKKNEHEHDIYSSDVEV